MRVGLCKDKGQKWFLGAEEIEETSQYISQYTYLGDFITNDRKNRENLKARKTKVTTITVKTTATNEVTNNIETAVLLKLHEKICNYA